MDFIILLQTLECNKNKNKKILPTFRGDQNPGKQH